MEKKYSISYFWRIVLGSLAVFFSLRTFGQLINNIAYIPSYDKNFSITITGYLAAVLGIATFVMLALFIFSFNKNTRLQLHIIFWMNAVSLFVYALNSLLQYFLIDNEASLPTYILLISSLFINAVLFVITAVFIKKKASEKSITLLSVLIIISSVILNFPFLLQSVFSLILPSVIFPLLLLNIKSANENEEKDEWDSFLQSPNVKQRIFFGFSAVLLAFWRLESIVNIVTRRYIVQYPEIVIAQESDLLIFNLLSIIITILEAVALVLLAVYIFNLHKNTRKKLLTNALFLQGFAMVANFAFYLVRYSLAEELYDFMRLYCNTIFLSATSSFFVAIWFILFALVNKKRVAFNKDERLPAALILIVALIPVVFFSIWDISQSKYFIATKLLERIVSFLPAAIFPLLFLLYPKDKTELEVITEVSTDE